MRYFIYPKGVNGEGIADFLTIYYPHAEYTFIDDDNPSLSLERQYRYIKEDDVVLIASTQHFDRLVVKLQEKGISSIYNGIVWCGDYLNDLIRAYREDLRKCIGLVFSNTFIINHLAAIDDDLIREGYQVIYFIFVKELYDRFRKKGLCILSPHAILEQIDTVDMMLLANGEPTHKNVISVDFTHGFQGNSVLPFFEVDERYFIHALSCLTYKVCGSKKIEAIDKESFKAYTTDVEILNLGYLKLQKDFEEFEYFLANSQQDPTLTMNDCVCIAFTFLYDVELYNMLCEAIIEYGKKPILLLHPVYAASHTDALKAKLRYPVFTRDDFQSTYAMFVRTYCLITECSSMGYTFPLVTSKPTIIFYRDKAHYFGLKVGQYHYFDERIHLFANDTQSLLTNFAYIASHTDEYEKNIVYYRENECYHFYDAKETALQWINNFLKVKA